MSNLDFNDLKDFPVAKAQLIIQLFNSIEQNLRQVERLNETENYRLFENIKSEDKRWSKIIIENNIRNMKALGEFVLNQYKTLNDVQLIKKEIINKVEEIQNYVDIQGTNFNYLGQQMNTIKMDLKAESVYDNILAEWKAQLRDEKRYSNFPFMIPLMVLVTRIFSSAVIYSSETDLLCKRLINDIKASDINAKFPAHPFTISKLIEQTISSINNKERETFALSIYGEQEQYWDSTFELWKDAPNLFVICTTIISAIQGNNHIKDTSDKAILFCGKRNIFVSSVTDKNYFLKTVVNETATYCKARAKKYPF
ncbi:MAG: hypothetical protein KME55_26775 [Nostoc indistinguendum CM1-VF10]|jgi:hypothetical protein|nr:hypothetical protein [Nostoc indistinguendum CM1-VF10]